MQNPARMENRRIYETVAIRYDATTMEAPELVAKGTDQLAFKIREIAVANQVPVATQPLVAMIR